MSLVNVIDSIVITQEFDITKILAEWIASEPDITTYGELTSGQSAKLFINWSDQGGAVNLHEGDYFTFVVPEVFKQDSVGIVTDVPIMTTSDEVVATYSIYVNDENLKEVKITFTDYVETHTDISGDFWLLLFVGRFDTTETKTIDFIINGELAASGETTVNPSITDTTPYNQKFGHSAVADIYNGYYIFNWTVRLNMDEDPVSGFQVLANYHFDDIIPENSPHVFLTDEIRQQLGFGANDYPLRIGEYNAADTYAAKDRYALFRANYNNATNLWTDRINYFSLFNGYSRDGIDGGNGINVTNLAVSEKSLSANLGTLTRPTSIQYCTVATVKIAESALGDAEVVKLFENTFKTNYGNDITVSLDIHRFGSGGSAQGIIGDYDFWFTKADEKGDPLSGVMFSLYVSEDFEAGADRIVYSDAGGVVAFNKLPEGTFYVLETSVPSGYIKNTTVYKVVLDKDKFEIYYGETFQYRLSDIDNKVINTPQHVEPVLVMLQATKKLTGRTMSAGMFNFIVNNNAGVVVATGTNDAIGDIVFNEIKFDTPGIYTYTVKETRGTYSGITYDTSVFTVTVTVTDAGGGKLKADVTYPQAGVVFNNSYSQIIITPCRCPARSTKCRKSIKGTKVWIDNENARGTRPSSVEIILLRDGTRYKNIILDVEADNSFIFCCLPIWSNSGHEYDYQIDEAAVPGYTTKIEGYNVINTLIP